MAQVSHVRCHTPQWVSMQVLLSILHLLSTDFRPTQLLLTTYTFVLGLFATRDTMTILASFTLPDVISRKMQEQGHSKTQSDVISQLLTPVSMQILSTPLHLYGLDLYNRGVATNAERITFVGQEYVKTTMARMARIFPAFGVGGVINKYVRKRGNEALRGSYPAPV